MNTPKTPIRCQSCRKDITDKIKVIFRGTIKCEDCNIKEQ